MSLAPGVLSKQVTVPITGDTLREPNETLVLNLTSPDGARDSDANGLATILNDD